MIDDPMGRHARAGEQGNEILMIDGTLIEFHPRNAANARRLTT